MSDLAPFHFGSVSGKSCPRKWENDGQENGIETFFYKRYIEVTYEQTAVLTYVWQTQCSENCIGDCMEENIA